MRNDNEEVNTKNKNYKNCTITIFDAILYIVASIIISLILLNKKSLTPWLILDNIHIYIYLTIVYLLILKYFKYTINWETFGLIVPKSIAIFFIYLALKLTYGTYNYLPISQSYKNYPNCLCIHNEISYLRKLNQNIYIGHPFQSVFDTNKNKTDFFSSMFIIENDFTKDTILVVNKNLRTLPNADRIDLVYKNFCHNINIISEHKKK